MAYATIDDIELRLGDTLSADEADQLEAFIDDFSFFLDGEIERAHKTVGTNPGQIRPRALTLVTSQRALNYYLALDNPSGAVQISRSIGEVSEAVTLSGAGAGSNIYGEFWLSKQERSILGLSSAMNTFLNIEMEAGNE